MRLLFASVLLTLPLDLAIAQDAVDSLVGAEFAVETIVTVPGNRQPIVTTTTLFRGNQAYDVMRDSPSRAKFDFEGEQITLLSTLKQHKTTIAYAQLLELQAQITAKAVGQKGIVGFLADPQFINEFDATDKTIKLSSPYLRYEAQVESAPADVVESMMLFADWSAQLNSAIRLTPLRLPTARLALNDALREKQWHAHVVTLSGGPKYRRLGTVTSHHSVRAKLTEADRKLIATLENELETFREVSVSEFVEAQIADRSSSKR